MTADVEVSVDRTRFPRRSLAGPVVAAAVVVVLIAAPFFVSAFEVSVLNRILAFGLLAVSVDLLTGITGLPTLGQTAYFGVGAYVAALMGLHMTTFGPVQVLAAAACGALAAALTGWAAVRVRGTVFLMVTLAIGEIFHQAASAWKAIGGTDGLAGIPTIRLVPGGDAAGVAYIYWFILAVTLICVGLCFWIVRSPYGLTLRGIRDNEARMRALGYRTALAKYGIFVIAGAVAGVAGALWTFEARFVSPGDLSFQIAALALLSVVIGGAGSLWGPFLGAAVVILVRDELSTLLAGRGPLILGLAFVLIVYLLPRGLAGLVDLAGRARRKRVAA